MYRIDIKLGEDRSVSVSDKFSGIKGENNAAEINFTVPEDYAAYNKFLDILYKDGKKTQIALDISGKDCFQYVLPVELTSHFAVDMQVVLKYGSKIFKSRFFTLTFDDGINATEYLESEFIDSIETLYELKADKTELLKLKRMTDSFLPVAIYNEDMSNIASQLALKADRSELPSKLSELDNDNNTVTDENYIHTDNNYTNDEKSKLSGIAEGAEVNVQADWNQTVETADDYIKNKPDLSLKANISEVYNKAEIDDKLAGKQNELTFDDEPEYGSANPITSGAVWNVNDYLDSRIFDNADSIETLDYRTDYLEENKADKPNVYSHTVGDTVIIHLENEDNTYEIVTTPMNYLEIMIQDDEYSYTYLKEVSFVTGATAPQVSYSAAKIINWVGTDCSVSGTYSIFAPAANKHYDIIFYFNGSQFIGLVNGYVPAGGNS